ncbi:MAG: cupin domain-containing protein [Candidatus Bipolaricaulis sp.]|nr:cupin domain-containing protein [Candidatus Bipolaricaulis sp.]
MLTIDNTSRVAARVYDDASTVRGVEKRVLIGPKNGAPRFVMRHFRLTKGGHSPHHAHPWEHEVYILAGRGTVRFSGGSRPVGPGDFVYVPPMDEHEFANAADAPLEFLCVVPTEGDDG